MSNVIAFKTKPEAPFVNVRAGGEIHRLVYDQITYIGRGRDESTWELVYRNSQKQMVTIEIGSTEGMFLLIKIVKTCGLNINSNIA